MKTLIFFREGLSGHYLKSLIDDSDRPIGFRVDPWYPNIYNTPRPMLREDCMCVHPHLVDHENFSKDFDLILSIQVRQKIYHACYNNFYKKYLIENPHLKEDFANWQSNMLFWYDVTYYNIKEYHWLYQQDLVTNTYKNIVEFDHILEIDYLQQVFSRYFNRSLTDNMKQIVNNYASHQLKLDLGGDQKDMRHIVEPIPDALLEQSPWFASYCIFKYENNNLLQENQRQWSIDLVQRAIDKDFLIGIADQYQL